MEVGYRITIAAYQRARHAQALIRQQWLEHLGEADFVLTPIAPVTAPRIGSSLHTWEDGTTDDVNELLGRLAVPANITGLPSITLPGGTDSVGLPIGIQVIGRADDDDHLLSAAIRIAPHLYRRPVECHGLIPVETAGPSPSLDYEHRGLLRDVGQRH